MYKHPGVYIEHVPSGALAVETVATAVAAFVGPVKRGAEGDVAFITGVGAFAEQFGRLGDQAGGVRNLGEQPDVFGLAVNAYFANGGAKAYVVPVAGAGGVRAFAAVADPGGVEGFYFSATSEGSWSNGLIVRFTPVSAANLAAGYVLTLEVEDEPGKPTRELERFADVSLDPASGRYFAARLNALSKLVDVSRSPVADATTGGQTRALQSGPLTTQDLAAINAGETLELSVDGQAATVTFATPPTSVAAAATAIQAQVRAGGATPELDGFIAQASSQNRLLLISGGREAASAVEAAGGEGLRKLRLDVTAVHGGTVALPDLDDDVTDGTLELTANGADFVVTFAAGAADVADIAEQIQTQGRAVAAVGANFTAEAVDGRLVLFMDGVTDADDAVQVRGGTARGRVGLDGAAGPSRAAFLPYPAGFADGVASTTLQGGVDPGAPAIADYTAAFERLRDHRDVTILLLPGRVYAAGAGKDEYDLALAHAEFMQNRMVVVDPPDPSVAGPLRSPADVLAQGFPTSPYSALYYPWLNVTNPFYNPDTAANLPRTFSLAPSAFAAGLWGRIDGTRGVWKAPAGLEATVRGMQGPGVAIGNDLQDNLNEWGVNCIRSILGPAVVWGARTLATKIKPEFRYIPVRRTQNMIGESLYGALQAVVFEPNDYRLWAGLRAAATDFMDGLFRSGAFQGGKASDAYYVRCGLGSTMTQGDIDGGIVRLVVGFAPLKPAEFVVVQIQQIVGRTA